MVKLVTLLTLSVFTLGCAGALYTKGNGDAILPMSFGNAEFVTGEQWSCVSGGPISEGLVGMVGDLAGAVIGVFTGRTSEGTESSQDTKRQAGCLERQEQLAVSE